MSKSFDDSIYVGYLLSIDKEAHRVKVRIPSLHGGTVAPTRVLDKDLHWMRTIWDPTNEPNTPVVDPSNGKTYYVPTNKVVVAIGFEGGSRDNPIVLGRIW